MDTHVDSRTYTKNLRVNLYVYSCTIPFASRYMTKSEERSLAPMCNNFLNTSHSLSYSGIPVTKSQRVWPDYNGYRHTEWALSKYLFIVKEQIPVLNYRSYLTHYPMYPELILLLPIYGKIHLRTKAHLPV